MELTKLIEASVALIFVLCLVVLASIILRKLNESKFKGFKLSERRIKILEILPIDNKTKFLLIQKDNKEFFILSNPEKSEIIETKEALITHKDS